MGDAAVSLHSGSLPFLCDGSSEGLLSAILTDHKKRLAVTDQMLGSTWTTVKHLEVGLLVLSEFKGEGTGPNPI